MANINQDQQSTGRHSCPSVNVLSLPVCGRGGWSPIHHLPVLSHLVRVNMDQYPSLYTHIHTHTHTQIYKQGYQYYTVNVWDQARLCCTCALHPHERIAHLEELGADFELGRLAAGLLGTIPAVLDSLKQLVNSPRDDALLLLAQVHIEARPHGVGLPRTRLKHSSWVSVYFLHPNITDLCATTVCMF